jgi:Concanavalin A-like lectin/glucanases superfamily/GLEYA domain
MSDDITIQVELESQDVYIDVIQEGIDPSTFYLKSNPSGFITGVNLSNFYTKDNPSGFITGVDLLNYNLLYTTGSQIKSGSLIIGSSEAGVVNPNSPYTLSVQSNISNTWLEILNHSGANQGVFFGIDDNNLEQWNFQGGDILFLTSENPSAGTERLRITKSGNVGIGTSSPSEKLEIVGNLKVSNSGFFTNGIKVGNNSIRITEDRIDGGYKASSGNFTDGLLGIQYDGYFDNDPEWFKTANVKPIINEIVLDGSSEGRFNGIYAKVGWGQTEQGTSYYSGDNGNNLFYAGGAPSNESYWYLNYPNTDSEFISYDLETWVQNPDGPYGSVPPTTTITQTQNFENSTNFSANRALLNGTSFEWVGYFRANDTSNHNFYLSADEDAYFWIGDKALDNYTTGNADLYSNENNGSSLINLPLTSGVYYSVRLQWGHPANPTNLGLNLSYRNGIQSQSSDFSGLFFQGSVGKGFFIDAISGDASFAGNVQADSATFNTRPTVNGTEVLLSGDVVGGGTANFRYSPVSGVTNLLSNNRYSFDTLTGLSTGILPPNPQIGDEIELYDSAGAWQINPLIVDNNGNYIEQKLEQLECNVKNGLIKLIYTPTNNIGWRIYPMPAHSVGTNPLLQGLLAFWKLDDLTDSSGNGNSLTNNGDVQFVAGKIGNAAVFDGSNYLDVFMASLPQGSQDRTISFWFNSSKIEPQVPLYYGNSSDGELVLFYIDQNTVIVSPYGEGVNSPETLNDGNWHHILFETNNQTWLLYIDGVLKDSQYRSTSTNGTMLTMGFGPDGNTEGSIDAVGIWNRALSHAEVAVLYNNGNGIEI